MDMLAHENAVLDINNLLEISKDAGLENTGIRCVCRMSKITIGAAIWLKHLKNGLIRTFRRCEISQLCGFPNIIFYQQVVEPDECLLDIKGKSYSLRDAIRDESYSQKSLVIGVFMTFFDVHVNRIPYSGRLSYRELDPIDTLNHPMLDVERALLDELRIPLESAGYLHHNQRMVNTIIYASQLSQSYHVLQIADYDVSCI